MNPNPWNEWEEVVPGISALTSAELDQKLEKAAVLQQRTEKLICCYLTEIQDRRAYKEFGYSSIYDYARVRFGFKERKTRYMLFLGRKVKELPEIREALRVGRLGWVKATRIASVATRQDETMWLDSALSLTVEELDRRIKEGTDRLASVLHLRLSEDLRVLWENGLELARRVAGAEISSTEAFEYMVAEFVATYANGGAPVEEADEADERDEINNQAGEPVRESEPGPEPEKPSPPLPFAEPLALQECKPAFDREFRKQVLERDEWKCSYPGCNARRELTVHHIEFRSRGGPNELWNCTVLCAFHHALLHTGQITLRGQAPHHLDWTPPRLMREVLERRRNRPALWGELEVRAFPYDPVDAPAGA